MKPISIIFATFALAMAIGAVLGGRIPIGSQSVDSNKIRKSSPLPKVIPESSPTATPGATTSGTTTTEIPVSIPTQPTTSQSAQRESLLQPTTPSETRTTSNPPEIRTTSNPSETRTTSTPSETRITPTEETSVASSRNEASTQVRVERSTSTSDSPAAEATTQTGRTSGQAIPALW